MLLSIDPVILISIKENLLYLCKSNGNHICDEARSALNVKQLKIFFPSGAGLVS